MIKRLLIVFGICAIIAIYIIQILLFMKLGIYLDLIYNTNIWYPLLATFSIVPLWINIPIVIYCLISWIITGKIYKIDDYKKRYNNIIKIKQDKKNKEKGQLRLI